MVGNTNFPGIGNSSAFIVEEKVENRLSGGVKGKGNRRRIAQNIAAAYSLITRFKDIPEIAQYCPGCYFCRS